MVYACDQQLAAKRVLKLTTHQNIPRLKVRKTNSGFALPVPAVAPVVPIEQMSVTSFRSYLECPYLYYLRHVLKLGRLDDQAVELDSLQFGSLAHDVLQSFAESPLAHSDKANAIAALLTTRLDERAQMLFGKNRLPAVTLQLEQLTERLRAFAEWQAEWRSQGWELQEAEFLIDPDAAILRLGSDGALMRLSGRIDRIDYHPKEKRYAIFDYKTGESKLKISKIRDKKTQQWLDLQLPLYEFALREMGFNEAFDLGFLPIDGTGTELEPEMIRLSKEDLESATAKAIEVARLVRQGAFSPSEKRHRKNEYEVLYGTSVYFEAETENSGESEEEEAK